MEASAALPGGTDISPHVTPGESRLCSRPAAADLDFWVFAVARQTEQQDADVPGGSTDPIPSDLRDSQLLFLSTLRHK